ncbi:MAG: alanine dehydrogenase [Gammaproteobacteria bacterium]|nr:alanine dehydrogenase [Gammaproteobacteria bacterium]
MIIGIPLEIKPEEGRVALIPDACAELQRQGHQLVVQAGAGVLSGYPDQAYQQRGVEIAVDAATLYQRAELVIKVKEPIAGDLQYLQAHHRLFCFLHLAANEALLRQLQSIGLMAFAFETLTDNGDLPLLAPMSNIAGRIAVQAGAHYLHRSQGGKGILLGGLPGVGRGRVVVLGAGNAGGNAVRMAASMGAEVVVFDKRADRLQAMRDLAANVTALYPYADQLAEQVVVADLLIGAVLLAGARTPHLVSSEQVAAMQEGSVIVDISVDQGGCIETIHATDYRSPTYVESGVIHFGVTNMPGAVPRTASQALSAVIMPYVKNISQEDWQADSIVGSALNVCAGDVVYPGLED